MSHRARGLAALVAAALLALPACAKPKLKLEMSREVEIIPPTIQSLTLIPSGRVATWEKPQTIKVEMRGDPELEASFEVKGRPAPRGMREVEPGVYVGSFDVERGARGAVDVTGRLEHVPTGARQEVRVPGGLVLDADEPARSDACGREMAEEFERQLAPLTVRFEFNRADIPAADRERLAANKGVFAANPLCPIRIHGHADEVGSPQYNINLSIRRALEVRRVLVSDLGVSIARCEIYFHGESRPVDTSGTPEGQTRNRRVEFHALYLP